MQEPQDDPRLGESPQKKSEGDEHLLRRGRNSVPIRVSSRLAAKNNAAMEARFTTSSAFKGSGASAIANNEARRRARRDDLNKATSQKRRRTERDPNFAPNPPGSLQAPLCRVDFEASNRFANSLALVDNLPRVVRASEYLRLLAAATGNSKRPSHLYKSNPLYTGRGLVVRNFCVLCGGRLGEEAKVGEEAKEGENKSKSKREKRGVPPMSWLEENRAKRNLLRRKAFVTCTRALCIRSMHVGCILGCVQYCENRQNLRSAGNMAGDNHPSMSRVLKGTATIDSSSPSPFSTSESDESSSGSASSGAENDALRMHEDCSVFRGIQAGRQDARVAALYYYNFEREVCGICDAHSWLMATWVNHRREMRQRYLERRQAKPGAPQRQLPELDEPSWHYSPEYQTSRGLLTKVACQWLSLFIEKLPLPPDVNFRKKCFEVRAENGLANGGASSLSIPAWGHGLFEARLCAIHCARRRQSTVRDGWHVSQASDILWGARVTECLMAVAEVQKIENTPARVVELAVARSLLDPSPQTPGLPRLTVDRGLVERFGEQSWSAVARAVEQRDPSCKCHINDKLPDVHPAYPELAAPFSGPYES